MKIKLFKKLYGIALHTEKKSIPNLQFSNSQNTHNGAVLVLHIPIIKYIFEIYLSIICIAVGKNGKENIKGLKKVQLSTVIVTLLYKYLA